jgi:hypothetical protein
VTPQLNGDEINYIRGVNPSFELKLNCGNYGAGVAEGVAEGAADGTACGTLAGLSIVSTVVLNTFWPSIFTMVEVGSK